MLYLKVIAILFVPSLFSFMAWAENSTELRERAKALRQEAAELARKGFHEEAEQIERKVIAMVEEAEQLERQAELKFDARQEVSADRLRRLQERLEMLRIEERELNQHDQADPERLDEVRFEAKQLERKVRDLTGEREVPPHRKENGEQRRLEHLWAAVEHLRQAEMHEVANRVAAEAEAVERHIHARHQRHQDPPLRAIREQLTELRRMIERLSDEVHELRGTP